MFALPHDLEPGRGDRVSGITCPTCHGCLEVRVEGAGHLHFTCRVGHAFSLREVLIALERFLEDTVWAAIRGSEELAALLEDVIAHRSRLAEIAAEGTYEQRLQGARVQATALRAIVEADEPITFNDASSDGEHAGEGS
jgi:two-component system chemotaxis response regulator CheB